MYKYFNIKAPRLLDSMILQKCGQLPHLNATVL